MSDALGYPAEFGSLKAVSDDHGGAVLTLLARQGEAFRYRLLPEQIRALGLALAEIPTIFDETRASLDIEHHPADVIRDALDEALDFASAEDRYVTLLEARLRVPPDWRDLFALEMARRLSIAVSDPSDPETPSCSQSTKTRGASASPEERQAPSERTPSSFLVQMARRLRGRS